MAGASVGIDVITVQRIADDVMRWGETFLRRVLTPAESRWCAGAGPDQSPLRVASCLAAKESVVKVMGGRPAGFDWPRVELVPDGGPELAECRAVLDAGVDGAVVGQWTCRLADGVDAGPWRARAIRAAAVTQGGHVVAVAVAA